jgi:Ca2+-binding RTX toxin-like protein
VTLDGSGAATWNVTVPWSTLVSLGIADSHGSGTYPIALKATVTGGCGGSASAASILKVLNVAPTVGALILNQVVGGGPDVTLEGSFTDPGIGDDPFTVVVTWEAGVTQVVTPVLAGGSYTFSASHTYTSTGTKTVSVSVADDEGASGTGAASPITVRAALAGDGTLSVQGTAGDNNLLITTPGGGLVRVQGDVLGAPIEFPLPAVSQVLVDLGAGDDWLLIAPTLTLPVVAFGGSGNDMVIGGGGPTVFAGGDGNDTLLGGGGRNILIGGNGSDFLYGGSNQDILIGGRTIHDANAAALLALLAEWNSGHSLQNRIRNLLDGSGSVPGLNGTYFLSLDGNDSARDYLLGGAGTDWLLVQSGDRVLGVGDILTPS